MDGLLVALDSRADAGFRSGSRIQAPSAIARLMRRSRLLVAVASTEQQSRGGYEEEKSSFHNGGFARHCRSGPSHDAFIERLWRASPTLGAKRLLL